MFFPFFGFLSDNCWRRVGAATNPPGACFCDTREWHGSQARTNADFASKQMLSFLGVDKIKPPTGVKVGIISRRRKRFILNEYELVRAVQAMGHECVLLPLEAMTLYEQMAALRSLDVLVGIHGSGLDNSVFLHKGAVLVQLLPYSVEHKCTFRASAERAGRWGNVGLCMLIALCSALPPSPHHPPPLPVTLTPSPLSPPPQACTTWSGLLKTASLQFSTGTCYCKPTPTPYSTPPTKDCWTGASAGPTLGRH
ncbi:hypothetical protein B484DRAFT_24627 [Ochromonadaceae sp. CCMP2298]|nr:hypothetical protein B484DRAFT_24627 [Ochromonadaceae sp. CCMP2298]